MADLQALRLEFEQKVREHFPECLLPLKAALAVVAINSFQHNQQPVTLIFSGPSSSGKTLVLSLINPSCNDDELSLCLHRCDSFTAKSFVSHCANKTQKELEDIDLLPRIENKTLITKELAPIFGQKEDELRQTFSMLTSILDGRGYISTSGSQGQRGYNRPINFTWLGATTPLTNRVFRVMAQLGTRLMFFNTFRQGKSTDDLVILAQGINPAKHEEECTQSVKRYLVEFFRIFKFKTFDETTICFDTGLLRQLCIAAKLMAHLRAALTVKEEPGEFDEADRHMMVSRENEERAIFILKNIALGSALMEQRDHVNEFDIQLVKHIALSSCPEGRRVICKALLESGGRAMTRDFMRMTGLSRPTCLDNMKELTQLGVCKYSEGGHDEAHSIEVVDEFRELVEPAIGKEDAASV